MNNTPKSFEYFIEQCKSLKSYEIHSKILNISDFELNSYSLYANSNIKKIGSIFYNPNLVLTLNKSQIEELYPILQKMPFDIVQEYLKENYLNQ